MSQREAVTLLCVSADDCSSSEAAGEKTEQNDDDNIKSQEVRKVFVFIQIYLRTKSKDNALNAIPSSFS